MARSWGFLDPAEHLLMLLDDVRVDAYAGAIAAVVRPGDVVLDVGTGTGILAMLAARAGARRVFAVDRTGIVELARRHVADNGLAQVVEVLRADLADLPSLPEPPRVVIGELLGSFAPAEHQHRVYAGARRLARPDAVMMPARYRMVFGVGRGAALREAMGLLDDLHGLRLRGLAERVSCRPAFVRVEPDDLLGPEVEGPWLEADGPPPETLAARLRVERDGEVGALTLGFCAELAPGHLLRTAVGAPRTCWTQTLLPVHPPLPVRAGDELDVEVVPRIVTNDATWSWRVTPVSAPAQGRSCDAFGAMIGEGRDMFAQLRARPRVRGTVRPSAALRGWAAALGVELDDELSLDALAARLHAAEPARYPNVDEARQHVLALVAAADRL